MRQNTIVTLGASLMFGGLAVALARGWINDAIQSEFTQSYLVQTSAADSQTLNVPVMVIDADVGFGDILSPEMIRTAQVPEDLVPLGSFASANALFVNLEQNTIVLTPMSRNEIILSGKISGPGSRGSMSSLISDGMRGVSVRVDDVAGVSGFVLPGDYVDVIYTRDKTTRRNGNELISDILLENIRVLGIDQNYNPSETVPDVAETITLEVSVTDAQKLHIAMDAGKLSLVLRSAGDIDPALGRTIAQKQLAVSSKPAPVKRAARRAVIKPAIPAGSASAQVTIIRGDERDEVNVLAETNKNKTGSTGG